MNYGELETELAARLNAYFAANNYMNEQDEEKPLSDLFKAFEIPENEKQDNRPFSKATVYVQYAESSYAAVQSINQVSQTETVFVKLVFVARYNRGLGGLFDLVHYAKRSLLGYRPAKSATRMVMDKGPNWTQYENNSVQFEMQMKFDALITQAFSDEEPDGALFTKATFN